MERVVGSQESWTDASHHSQFTHHVVFAANHAIKRKTNKKKKPYQEPTSDPSTVRCFHCGGPHFKNSCDQLPKNLRKKINLRRAIRRDIRKENKNSSSQILKKFDKLSNDIKQKTQEISDKFEQKLRNLETKVLEKLENIDHLKKQIESVEENLSSELSEISANCEDIEYRTDNKLLSRENLDDFGGDLIIMLNDLLNKHLQSLQPQAFSFSPFNSNQISSAKTSNCISFDPLETISSMSLWTLSSSMVQNNP